tara:strand:- start:1031 stop:2020 length:990 start_codon:yes stop_codon:yes gene_type:complete
MSFLDNSGDIILDAVLTDTGRFRLAKGNGSFKITKFAFGDDEINYELYEKNHTSGSAYYDLKILQTPILEAFSNNASSMHSKLVTIPRTDLLFMPIIKQSPMAPFCTANNFTNMYVVCTTVATEDKFIATNVFSTSEGVMRGVRPGLSDNRGKFIQLDQGLDTTKISQAFALDPDLKENQYIVQIDNRLGRLVTGDGSPTPVSYIDDDNIATYYLSKGGSYGSSNSTYYVGDLAGLARTAGNVTFNNNVYDNTNMKGPLGTYVTFKIAASVSLNTSDFLFNTLGGGSTLSLTTIPGSTSTVKFIDSTIKVTGATTGYSVDIPVRFIKSV